jgi:hypothetical protein
MDFGDFHPLVVIDDCPTFLMKLVDLRPTFIVFEVYEISIYRMNPITDECDQPDEIELYVKGTIKWDGCSHLWFGDKDGYIHLHGKSRYDVHCQLIQELFAFAEKNIERFNRNVAYS